MIYSHQNDTWSIYREVMASKTSLVEGDVPTVLRQFAIPMGFGLICMILVNVIDTYWVSKLGTQELAAMSLSFPVIGFVTNISFGLMIGATTALSRTIGSGDQEGREENDHPCHDLRINRCGNRDGYGLGASAQCVCIVGSHRRNHATCD